MKLETYRVSRGLTYAGLASEIGGITPKMAERYCKGTKPRSHEIMRRIYQISDSAVEPNDWYDLKEPSHDSCPVG